MSILRIIKKHNNKKYENENKSNEKIIKEMELLFNNYKKIIMNLN